MFLLLFVVFCAVSQCNANASTNVLVLLENLWVKESHSEFLNMITSKVFSVFHTHIGRGYSTTLKTADDPSLDLMKFGEYIYGHLVILAPSVDDPNNPLLINVVHADRTSYSYNSMKVISDYPNTVGVNTQLITALQARNNARVLLVGSLDFFSNTFFASPVSNALNSHSSPVAGNQDLTDSLLRWTLGERGQLRVVSVDHYRIADKMTPQQYTIMDEIFYAIKVETKNDAGDWVPYHAKDFQLEFIRIDPFIRRTLSEKDGAYSTVLKLPDVYGVFRFVVDYNRLGYTHLLSIAQVPVRPFTHTQYERFIEGAFPYYTSALSMVVGLLVFSFLFLYYKDEKEKGE